MTHCRTPPPTHPLWWGGFGSSGVKLGEDRSAPHPTPEFREDRSKGSRGSCERCWGGVGGLSVRLLSVCLWFGQDALVLSWSSCPDPRLCSWLRQEARRHHCLSGAWAPDALVKTPGEGEMRGWGRTDRSAGAALSPQEEAVGAAHRCLRLEVSCRPQTGTVRRIAARAGVWTDWLAACEPRRLPLCLPPEVCRPSAGPSAQCLLANCRLAKFLPKPRLKEGDVWLRGPRLGSPGPGGAGVGGTAASPGSASLSFSVTRS